MLTVSIVIPAYNEEKTIGELLNRILNINAEFYGYKLQLIVVDDGSIDNTSKIVSDFKNVILLRQHNKGKGAAVQSGVRVATGEYILIQDADLEYSPSDYIPMLEALKGREIGTVCVYGSRTLGSRRSNRGKRLMSSKHNKQKLGPWLAGHILTIWCFLLYGKWITDTLTGYKIYPRNLLLSLDVKTSGFETDHEITAKLLKRNVDILEVPINYYPRTVHEGKKIRAIDGIVALKTMLRFRLHE